MYYGKMTKQLERLYAKYAAVFGVEPDFYVDVEYSDSDRKEYIRDIKEALRRGVELSDLYPDDDEY